MLHEKTFAFERVSLPILTQMGKDTGIWGGYQYCFHKPPSKLCLFTNPTDLPGIPFALLPPPQKKTTPKQPKHFLRGTRESLLKDSATALSVGTANHTENMTRVFGTAVG